MSYLLLGNHGVFRAGATFGPSFSPSILNPTQWALDGGNPYEVGSINQVQHLRSLEAYNSYRAPRSGRAWLFDGVNDIATGPSIAAVLGANQRSYCIRALANGSSNQCLMASGSFAALGYFGLTLNSGTWTLNAAGLLLNTGIANDGLVHTHIVTYDGSLIRWYIDGTLSGTSTATTLNTQVSPLTIGARAVNDFFLNGRVEYASVFSRVLTSDERSLYQNSGINSFGTSGLQAHYPCSEESGTIGYDISGNANHLTLTNITQATFHATNTSVTQNRNNSDGYRLSGAVFIPKRLTDTNAADGNALTFSGQAPYPTRVDVPSITGDGTNVFANLGSALIPATADFNLSFWYFHLLNDTTLRVVLSQWASGQAGRFSINANALGVPGRLAVGITGADQIVIDSALLPNTWHRIALRSVSGVLTLDCLPAGGLATSGTVSNPGIFVGVNTTLLTLGTTPSIVSNGSVCDLIITTGGITTHFPLQDGPGSSNTNRNLSFIRSNETFGIVSNAIVNGTVSTIWANRCPHARDWCVEYGGNIAANGAFLPGQISGSLAADGTTKTLSPGKFGNPFSRINFNPFTAAELNGLGLQTSYAVTSARQSVAPVNTKFRRTKVDGDDRFITTRIAPTGSNLTNLENYVS